MQREEEKDACTILPVFSAYFQTFGFLWRLPPHRNVNSRMNARHTDGVIVQRRAAVRYKLCLPVIFHWNDGEERTGAGFTSDLALDGALIRSNALPPVGSEVHLEVLFPSPEAENEGLCIGCSGKVVHQLQIAGVSAFGFHGMFQDDQLMSQMPDQGRLHLIHNE